MRIFRSLLFQVVLWAILPLIAITAVSIVSVYGHQQAERKLVADRAARLAHVTATALANQLADNTGLLQTLAQAGDLVALDGPNPQNRAAESGAPRSTFDRGMVLLKPDGRIDTGIGDASSWAARPVVEDLRRSIASGSNAEVASFQPNDDGEVVTLLAVRAPDGGTLLGAFSPTSLGIGHLLEDLQFGPRGMGYVVDDTGRILYHQQPGVTGDIERLPGLAEVKAGGSGALFYEDGGEVWAVGYSPVASAGWGVLVREAWTDAIGPMVQFSIVSPLLVIVAALLSLAAVYVILSYVIRPLQRLGQMADRVAWGDFAAVEEPLSGVQETRELHTTLRHMVAQIRGYQAGMQDYVTAVTQGQEEERKRLARELHDDTAQSLVGLVQRIKLARRDLKRDPAHVEVRLVELEQLATAAWQDVRRFSEDLRPAYLEQFGLEPALATLTQQAGTTPGAPEVLFEVGGTVVRLPAEVELALFRIAQEALNNVRRHAAARQVHVRLTYTGAGATVSVEDDGSGFTAPVLPGGLAQSGHFGLAGIRERTLLIGGRLALDTGPGRGTRLEVFVPVTPASE